MNELTHAAHRPLWAEINLDALRYNFRNIKSSINQDTKIMGVVKANSYGHGSVECAKILDEEGADAFAVAILEEGIELRKGGIAKPILILGMTESSFAEDLLKYDINASCSTVSFAKSLNEIGKEHNKTLGIHIAIDSGMGRIGFSPEEAPNAIEEISNLPYIKINGMFTHFSTSDSADSSYTNFQIENFKYVIDELKKKDMEIPIIHCSNSAAILTYPQLQMNMVRPGIILYGYYASDEVALRFPLRPVMTLKARIVHLKDVPENTSISYARTFTTGRPSKIAVLPIGYADGFPRLLSNRAKVLINGVYAPQIGNICMDQMMVDVTDVPDVRVGDVAILLGNVTFNNIPVPRINSVSGYSVAEKAETIVYELTSAVQRRVPRIYVNDNGEILSEKNYLY